MSNLSSKKTFFWRKLIRTDQADEWVGKIYLKTGLHAIVTEKPGAVMAHLEVHSTHLRLLKNLISFFDGRIHQLKSSAWKVDKPFILRVGKNISIGSDKGLLKKCGGEVSILIRRGLAFGTGDHATTAMCVRQIVQRIGKAGQNVLDVGTGSGILAFVASALGNRVTAIDFDEAAIREAKWNQKANRHIPKITWLTKPIESFNRGSYDWIVANVYSECLIGSEKKFYRLLRNDGGLILSGILKEQGKDVERAFRKHFDLVQKLRRGKWLCFVFAKKP